MRDIPPTINHSSSYGNLIIYYATGIQPHRWQMAQLRSSNAEHSGKHLGWFVGNNYLCYDDWLGNKPAVKEPNNLKIPVITRFDYASIAVYINL